MKSLLIAERLPETCCGRAYGHLSEDHAEAIKGRSGISDLLRNPAFDVGQSRSLSRYDANAVERRAIDEFCAHHRVDQHILLRVHGPMNLERFEEQ